MFCVVWSNGQPVNWLCYNLKFKKSYFTLSILSGQNLPTHDKQNTITHINLCSNIVITYIVISELYNGIIDLFSLHIPIIFLYTHL